MAKPPPAMTQAERREARLAEALRANLARRKARARGVVDDSKDDEEIK